MTLLAALAIIALSADSHADSTNNPCGEYPRRVLSGFPRLSKVIGALEQADCTITNSDGEVYEIVASTRQEAERQFAELCMRDQKYCGMVTCGGDGLIWPDSDELSL